MSSPKPKPENKKSQTQPSSGFGSVMVGVLFDDGIVLAIHTMGNLIYYLDDHIYCGASSTGFDRESLMEVSTKLENIARNNSNKGVTVAQALDLIVKLYEQVETAELLLAGEDPSGLHLIALKCPGTSARVNYAALGPGSAASSEYLKSQWRPDMNLRQAEQLARAALLMGNMSKVGVDVCIIFKRSPESATRVEGHDSS
ncbi:uncharacterized protein yip3 [Drosophila montana]|uniref:uncharacterized protein yip3 n=1 Tax=Drosophila montana TaxID=40370 RepID=UPI00313A789C